MTEFKDPVAVPHKYRNRFLRESGVGSVTVTSSSSGGSSTPSWSSISGKPSWITMDTPAVSTFTNDAGYLKSSDNINAKTLDSHESSYFINTDNIGSQLVAKAGSLAGYTTAIEVGGDADTYYPVTIKLSYSKEFPQYISIWKNLGSKTASYSGNHPGGTSSMWLQYACRQYVWDGNGGYVHTLYRSMPYASLCAKTEIPTSESGSYPYGIICVWLRGGGTTYNISTNYESAINIYYEKTLVYTYGTYNVYVEPVTELGNIGVLNTANVPIIAANATKATQDGDGNVIADKYITLDTAQTITGAKTFKGMTNLDGVEIGGNEILMAGNDVFTYDESDDTLGVEVPIRIGSATTAISNVYISGDYLYLTINGTEKKILLS